MVWKPCTLTAFTGISRDYSENLSPTFPLTFCHSRDTCAHLLKLDIVSTVHCSPKTFNETHLLAMWVLSLIETHRDRHDEYVTVYTTQHNRVPMSGWEKLNVFWNIRLDVSVFVSAETCTCLNSYIMKWHEVRIQSWVISAAVTDPGPLKTLNTLYNGIHTTNTLLIQRYTP